MSLIESLFGPVLTLIVGVKAAEAAVTQEPPLFNPPPAAKEEDNWRSRVESSAPPAAGMEM